MTELHEPASLEAETDLPSTDTDTEYAAVAAWNAACVHARLGNRDEALDWLEKSLALPNRWCQASFLMDDDLRDLHADSQFQDLAASLPSTRAQPSTPAPPRACARLAYFGFGAPGQLAVDYGPVPWKQPYAKALADGKYDGQRWRLGRDFWTTLDTSMRLRVGETVLEAGQYYLVLDKRPDGHALIVLDPATIRSQQVDASSAGQTTGGVAIPLEHELRAGETGDLSFSFEMGEVDTGKGDLVIRFGPHELRAPLSVVVFPSGEGAG